MRHGGSVFVGRPLYRESPLSILALRDLVLPYWNLQEMKSGWSWLSSLLSWIGERSRRFTLQLLALKDQPPELCLPPAIGQAIPPVSPRLTWFWSKLRSLQSFCHFCPNSSYLSSAASCLHHHIHSHCHRLHPRHVDSGVD